jgi:hypothetical protein
VVYTYMAAVLDWTRRRKRGAIDFPVLDRPQGSPVGAD